MSREDFDRCTPSEFYEVYSHWAERQRDNERSAWERTRVVAMFSIQPYTKGNVTAHDVLPLPWDNETEKEQREELSREELMARFEAARIRNGLE